MKTLEEINKIREEKRKELDLRVNVGASTHEKHILVCHGTGCTSSKSPKIIENFKKIIQEKNIEKDQKLRSIYAVILVVILGVELIALITIFILKIKDNIIVKNKGLEK